MRNKEKVNPLFYSNKNAKWLKRKEYIHMQIYKGDNCFFRSMNVYLTDSQYNFIIIRKLHAIYAKIDKKVLSNFYTGNYWSKLWKSKRDIKETMKHVWRVILEDYYLLK